MRNLRASILQVLRGRVRRLRARQGPARRGSSCVRHVLRNAADRHRDAGRPADRPAARRRRDHRDRLRRARRRPADGREHLRARLSGDPGADARCWRVLVSVAFLLTDLVQCGSIPRVSADERRWRLPIACGGAGAAARDASSPPSILAGLVILAPRRRRGSVSALRSARLRLWRAARSRRAPRTPSAPTSSAATCSRAPSAAAQHRSADRALRDHLPARSSAAVVGAHASAMSAASPTSLFGRLVDLVVTFPFLVLVIAIVAVLGPGLINMYIAVGVVGWVFYARLMRAEVLVQTQQRLRGRRAACSAIATPRIMLPPHPAELRSRPILVYWVTDMALAILLGSSLGYLGLGAQPPTAEWGVLIADGKNFFTQAPWIDVLPRPRHRLVRPRLQPHRRRPRRPPRREALMSAAAAAPRASRICSVTFDTPRGDAARRRRRRASRSRAGEVLGLVGESGSGKSVTLRAIPRLAARQRARSAASVRWRGEDLLAHARAAPASRARPRDRDDLPGADDGAQSRC